ncbi:hypothetical protein [Sporosarcina highlanderae]|uniref:Replication protein n=1 Tax=Sporosarcina highlanderae TaxID=3035916 RepID=A0ABT8JVP5_9BACL|nr:hypothetical protein [Sporosarcina highlanderae]MDN4609154.1 hypothetical protein [Sporosarcina highlanderae]
MQNGWIKLHRKIQDNGLYADSNMLKLWIHCLLKASHKERNQLIGNQMVELKPGEFVTGRESLAEEFNRGVSKAKAISPITLWRWLNNFEKWGMLNIKKTTKYSVVTITNWCEHQQDEQQVNNKRTTDEQQVNTNKNVKNDKNDKKENIVHQDELFEQWWELYANKKGRAKCLPKYRTLLKKYPHEQIMTGTKKYMEHRKGLLARNEFCPQQKNPLTFLNGEHFNDEYDSSPLQPIYKEWSGDY